MATGLAANLEVFANGQVIFSQNADLQECGPEPTADELIKKLNEGGIMGQLDTLRGQGAELVFQMSLYTSNPASDEGTLLVDGLAGDEIPGDNSSFETRLRSEVANLHSSLVEQGYIVNNCKSASDADSGGARFTAAGEGVTQIAAVGAKPM
ncbi:MAG: hypothetical protein KDI65_00955 [Alphaproteobacteria bacterium]|nr:hypothetical protein [Alphaproteobacteria bacterium]